MIPRGVRFAHVALLVFSAFLAFLVLRAVDEELILGASATIEVDQSNNAVSSPQVVSAIESFADAHDVNVGHVAADLNDPDNLRHLYLAVGDPKTPSASWLADGYPSFSRGLRTEVHPLGEIDHMDPRGSYVVFGPPQAARELLAQLKGLGLSGQVVPRPSLAESIQYFGSGGVLWCFLVVAVAAVMVIGSSVVLNAKAYGVLRLQGKSFARILGRDMAQLAAFWVRAAVVVVAVAVACLAAYNGLDQLGLFGLIAAGLLVAFAVPALAAHVLALSLTYRTRIAHAIKGEVSATLAMVGAYAIRIPAALLALAVVVSAVTTGQDVAARQASREAYAKVGDASSVLLWSNPSNPGEEMKTVKTVGPWIRQHESRGGVILAAHSKLMDIAPASVRVPDCDVLIVNNTYLAEQSILDPSGHRLRGVSDSRTKAQVLIPESLSGDAGRFTDPIAGWLKFQAKVAGGKLDAARGVETVATKSGQSVFTYGSGMYTGQPAEAFVRDPIIVVVPGSSGILGNAEYVAYATQNAVIFKDPGDVRTAMSTDVGRYVIAMSPVAQHAADEYQNLIREFRLALFNTALALTVLLISAISVSLIYRRKNAQGLFVKYISGWTFVKAYRSLLALEGALALALVGWTMWNTWSSISTIQTLKAEGIPPPPDVAVPLGGWEPVAMLALVVLGVMAVVLTALTGSYRRSVGQRGVEE
ncbi:MAG: bacteriocin-associated integral membrane family protein [Rubrobacteraceae bacterium]